MLLVSERTSRLPACFLYLLLLMVVNMYKHMAKVVINILQGSAVTQTALGGLTMYRLVPGFDL